MVIMKIKCGLGNQMFQYALGKRLALDWNSELKVDLSWFNNIKVGDIPRELEMDSFNVMLNEATEAEIDKAMPSFFARMIDKIRGRINRNHFYRFYPQILKKKKNVYLDGYFQSYKYFESIRDILLDEFTLKQGYNQEVDKVKEEIEKAGQSVAVHVRRGDFATIRKGYNGLCDLYYYEKALLEIKKKYADVKLFIFSDDIEWVKANIKLDSPMVFVSQPILKSAEELWLMSLCKHQIIANSTFSWWSAWLNLYPYKIVVSPSRWLVVEDIKTDNLLPSSWIKI
ncbi:MAG: alpha-1,2-fucosyltransferase [Candidatus Magasanikbacteria bacterium]